MAYTINKTDGTVLTTVNDGTTNTSSSSLTLVGKNYAGYGEFLNENFVKLLENSSNSSAPSVALEGQLWWDSTNNLLKVYDGSSFKVVSAATASASTPSGTAVTGDLWWDTTNSQLKVYNGTGYTTVGPLSTPGQGTTGAIPTTISDTLGGSHTITQMYAAGTIIGIWNPDATFTPSPAISGFTTISPGLNISTTVSSAKVHGTATNADALGSIAAANYLSTSTTSFTTDGSSTITFANGLTTNAITKSGTDGVGNIGSTSNAFNTVHAKATSAQYADLAERFETDQAYPAGTVVELGGVAEITKAVDELTDNVFGVISDKAAYLMNGAAGSDETHPPVAMTGRVPVMVKGVVMKGDRLVSAGNGFARAATPSEVTAFNVIGRALESKTTEGDGTVEAIVKIN